MSAVRIDSLAFGQHLGFDQPFGADWLPGTDYSAFGLTLRVALAGDRRRCAASSNRACFMSAVRIDGDKQWSPGNELTDT
jgi:hypothetical protein